MFWANDKCIPLFLCILGEPEGWSCDGLKVITIWFPQQHPLFHRIFRQVGCIHVTRHCVCSTVNSHRISYSLQSSFYSIWTSGIATTFCTNANGHLIMGVHDPPPKLRSFKGIFTGELCPKRTIIVSKFCTNACEYFRISAGDSRPPKGGPL